MAGVLAVAVAAVIPGVEVQHDQVCRPLSGSAVVVKPGTNIVWSKWLTAGKETLRAQYGSQVESMERVLPEESHPVEKPERAKEL